MDDSDYLYVVRPTRPEMLSDGMTETEKDAVAAHFEYLRELADRGVVRLAGRTLDSGAQTFGLVVFAATAKTEAQRLVDNDPAVRESVMTAELFPFPGPLYCTARSHTPPLIARVAMQSE